jgi:hypothetical protein
MINHKSLESRYLLFSKYAKEQSDSFFYFVVIDAQRIEGEIKACSSGMGGSTEAKRISVENGVA